ncbi:hypothetical protein D3C75_752760 [compost metagenome]
MHRLTSFTGIFTLSLFSLRFILFQETGFRMNASHPFKQRSRLQRTAHRRQYFRIGIPFAQDHSDLLCFLCRNAVGFVQNQHRSTADLLLHKPVGRPLLGPVQLNQMRSIYDGDQAFQLHQLIQRGFSHRIDDFQRVSGPGCLNDNNIRGLFFNQRGKLCAEITADRTAYAAPEHFCHWHRLFDQEPVQIHFSQLIHDYCGFETLVFPVVQKALQQCGFAASKKS